jgi:hypothetical protein
MNWRSKLLLVGRGSVLMPILVHPGGVSQAIAYASMMARDFVFDFIIS